MAIPPSSDPFQYQRQLAQRVEVIEPVVAAVQEPNGLLQRITDLEALVQSLQAQQQVYLGEVDSFPVVDHYAICYHRPYDGHFFYDTSRGGKWLSVNQRNFSASRNGTTSNYLRWFNGSPLDTNSGMYVPSPIILATVSMSWDRGSIRSGKFGLYEWVNNKHVEIWSTTFEKTDNFTRRQLDIPVYPNRRIYWMFGNTKDKNGKAAAMYTPRLTLGEYHFWGNANQGAA